DYTVVLRFLETTCGISIAGLIRKNYNIMDAGENINLSKNEVTEKCLERSLEECMAGAKQGCSDKRIHW
ncbi:hypothetical protein AVEN_132961-1, partial [Araneus ventricosus]